MSFKETKIGRIPKEWDTYKLSECTTKITDGTHSTVKDNPEGEYFLLSCKNIKGGNVVLGNKERLIDLETLTKLRKRTGLQNNDILLTTVGTIGESALVKDIEINYELQRSVAIIRPELEKVYPKFMYYVTKDRYFRGQTDGMIKGSVQKCLYLGEIANIVIPCPAIEEQKHIAKILSDLDDKIEVNNKINKRLEDIAQSIFKHWFVDFEFPGIDGKPYKSSGGEMVYSELGMIPKGWDVKEIGKLPLTVTDYVANGSFKSLKDNVTIYEEENYALFIRNTDLKCKFSSSKRFVDEHAYNFLAKSRLYGGEVIISNVGDVGSVYICPSFNIPMTLGNNVIMINTDENKVDLNKYIFRLFKSHLGQYLLGGITGGSAQLKFNKTDFRNIKLIIPNENTLKLYNKVVGSIEDKILHNDTQNERLSKLRDTLLPKLMSGEIRVPLG